MKKNLKMNLNSLKNPGISISLNSLRSLKTLILLAVLAAAVTMTSCNNNEELNDNAPVEIRLSSALSVQTRAAYPETDTQIPSGETVKVYVDEVKDVPEQLYGGFSFIADGDGALGEAGTDMYFPRSGNNVNIYAFHTNPSLIVGSYPASLTHTVIADQSAIAGYAVSDLLYAKATNVARQTTAVELTFYHLLSKVQIAVKAGAGFMSPLSLIGATITIESTKLQANFTPDKADDIDDIVITPAGDVTPITLASDLPIAGITTDFASPVYHDAIIVPQTLLAGTNFIKVHLISGGDLYYKIPPGDDGMTFESGKKYLYHITVNLTGLTVTSTIADWTSAGAPTNGNAEM
jgi:hypothetical protein